MPPTARMPAALLAWSVMALAPMAAQAQALTEACANLRFGPVTNLIDLHIDGLAQSELVDGVPVIRFNPAELARFSPPTRMFWAAHECAHHALGHVGAPHRPGVEQEADCWAVAVLWGGGILGPDAMAVVQAEVARLPGGPDHLPGPARAASLPECLSRPPQPPVMPFDARLAGEPPLYPAAPPAPWCPLP